MCISYFLKWSQFRYGLSENEYKREVYRSLLSPVIWLAILIGASVGFMLLAWFVTRSEEAPRLLEKILTITGLGAYWIFSVVGVVLLIKIRIKKIAGSIDE